MLFKKQGRLSEATIQAEIYHQLKILGIVCYLEYPFNIIYKGKARIVRADLVVVKNDNIVCVCEVKNHILYNSPNKKTLQYHKYEILGIPFFYCMNVSQIGKCVSDIARIHNICP